MIKHCLKFVLFTKKFTYFSRQNEKQNPDFFLAKNQTHPDLESRFDTIIPVVRVSSSFGQNSESCIKSQNITQSKKMVRVCLQPSCASPFNLTNISQQKLSKL